MYKFIPHRELVEVVKHGEIGKDYAIVDVRDDDYAGGNIPGAIRAPSEYVTEQSVASLVKKLDGVPKVIFHCALSQVRGPTAAGQYSKALAASNAKAKTAAPPALLSTTDVQHSSPDAARNFSPNPFHEAGPEQEVLVLRDGFQGWQSLYRKDPALVENFDVKVWGAYAA